MAARSRHRRNVRRAALLLFLAANLGAALGCSDWSSLTRCNDGHCDDGGSDAAHDAGGSDASIDASLDGNPSACDAAGVDISLVALGDQVTRPLDFPTAPRQTRFLSTPGGGQCPLGLDPGPEVPVRAYVVQNATTSPATLAAWAVCTTSTDEAFLTFYRRSTPPATTAEITACASWVADGVGGSGGFDSPEEEGRYCPGLTKANHGGLRLDVCEVAVVYIQQPYPERDALSPAQMRIALQ